MFDRLIAALETELPAGDREYRLEEILPLNGYLDGKAPREAGVAVLCREGEALCVYAALRDSDAFNDARKEGDKTWLLGDVFELFLQKPGKEEYFEFHATPSGLRLQLRFRDYRNRRENKFKEKLCEAELKVESRVRAAEKLWLVKMSVPLEVELTGTKFLFGRYNYTRGTEEPEISSSAVMESTFHYPPLWHVITS